MSRASVPPKVFIVFGMPRTGTTYLYHALSKHPDIHVPYRKESHFFSVNYAKGLDWFASLYADMQPGQVGADINPMYYLDALAVERIQAYDPDVKIVLGVREPTDFAISLYGNMLAHGLKVPPITDVVQDFDWPVTPHTSLRFSLAGGFLERRVRELQAAFGPRLMLYDFAAFDRSPLPILQAMESFLGLRKAFDADNVDTVRINASGRRNPFMLNALIANQRVLDVLYAALPKSFIRRARQMFERLSARNDGQTPASGPVSEAERRALESVFATDAAYYRALFAAGPIIVPASEARPAAATV